MSFSRELTTQVCHTLITLKYYSHAALYIKYIRLKNLVLVDITGSRSFKWPGCSVSLNMNVLPQNLDLDFYQDS